MADSGTALQAGGAAAGHDWQRASRMQSTSILDLAWCCGAGLSAIQAQAQSARQAAPREGSFHGKAHQFVVCAAVVDKSFTRHVPNMKCMHCLGRGTALLLPACGIGGGGY